MAADGMIFSVTAQENLELFSLQYPCQLLQLSTASSLAMLVCLPFHFSVKVNASHQYYQLLHSLAELLSTLG